MKYLGIRYPFTNSDKEKFFLDLNNTDTNEIKTIILYYMLTPINQRYRMPNFGSDLLKFIFEPNDEITIVDIKNSFELDLNKYIPGVKINNVIVDKTTETNYSVYLRVDYTIQDGVFVQNDFVELFL